MPMNHDGFDWMNGSLYIAEFALPMVVELREKGACYPEDMCPAQWDAILGEIIYALEGVIAEWDNVYTHDQARVSRGLKLFGKHFQSLWS